MFHFQNISHIRNLKSALLIPCYSLAMYKTDRLAKLSYVEEKTGFLNIFQTNFMFWNIKNKLEQVNLLFRSSSSKMKENIISPFSINSLHISSSCSSLWFHPLLSHLLCIIFFFVALRPNAGHGLLILEVF